MATMKKPVAKKAMAKKKMISKKPMMQAPPTASAPMGGPMMKKGGKVVKKAQGGDTLRTQDLSALAHQKRGMGPIGSSFVKKSDGIKNELGTLTPYQKKQLEGYMNKSGTAKKMYEALPNVGRIVGSSAADIPKNSKLQRQKMGGVTKKKKC